MTKICSSCKQQLQESDFYVRMNGKLAGSCKKCRRKKQKLYSQTHPNPKKSHIKYKQKYNLSWNQVLIMLQRQKYKCEICGKLLDQTTISTRKSPVVDHSHETNKIRGILCRNCNFALGLIYDDINILKNMIKYLNKYQRKHSNIIIQEILNN